MNLLENLTLTVELNNTSINKPTFPNGTGAHTEWRYCVCKYIVIVTTSLYQRSISFSWGLSVILYLVPHLSVFLYETVRSSLSFFSDVKGEGNMSKRKKLRMSDAGRKPFSDSSPILPLLLSHNEQKGGFSG